MLMMIIMMMMIVNGGAAMDAHFPLVGLREHHKKLMQIMHWFFVWDLLAVILILVNNVSGKSQKLAKR